MRPIALLAATAAVLLATAGCIAGAPASPASAGGSPSIPSPSPTETSGSTAFPSPERCATDALARPETTDGLDPSPYPEPPPTANASIAADYLAAFEEAYLRNAIIAEAGEDADMNLTRASVHATPENATGRGEGYVVVLAVSAGTKYESGVHGDRWPTVGYFVNGTHLVRRRVDSVNASVDPAPGTVLLRCDNG